LFADFTRIIILRCKQGGLPHSKPLCSFHTHEAIISDEMFITMQQEKLNRAKDPEKVVAMKLVF